MTKKYLNAFLTVIVALIGVMYLTKVAGDLHAFHGLGKLVSYFSWALRDWHHWKIVSQVTSLIVICCFQPY